MNTYLKSFLHRGFIFGGFGPVTVGIVFFIISRTVNDFSLTGEQVLLAIASTYLLAFVHAGASIFNQIEHWSIAKSVLFHFITLYLGYVTCYTVNSWIPFEPMMLVIFTAAFAAIYLVIWLTVYLVIRSTEKKLNKSLK